MPALIVTAQIKKILPHPDAKKLKLCTVFDGVSDHQIVCGAANAREGMITIMAQTGSTLVSGMKIEKATLRGVDSYGMLCSAKELGMTDEGGIIDLPPGTSLGLDYQVLPTDSFSSIPWYAYEEKEAFWQDKSGKYIVITRDGQGLKDPANYSLISRTYWAQGKYLYRHFS